MFSEVIILDWLMAGLYLVGVIAASLFGYLFVKLPLSFFDEEELEEKMG